MDRSDKDLPFFLKENMKINYQVTGEGIPILFITPQVLTNEIFRYQREQLSKKYQIITFDIRGHGRSSHSEAPITYSMIIEDIVDLLKHLGIEKAFLCGYSTGGSVVLEGLITHPSLFYGGILLGAISEVGDWFLQTELLIAKGLCDLNLKKTIAKSIALGNADNRKTFSRLYQDAMLGDVVNWAEYFDASLKFNCTSMLKSISNPVLLLYGSKNILFHKYAHLINGEIKQSELIMIKGIDHNLPTKGAEETNKLIDTWIEKLSHFR